MMKPETKLVTVFSWAAWTYWVLSRLPPLTACSDRKFSYRAPLGLSSSVNWTELGAKCKGPHDEVVAGGGLHKVARSDGLHGVVVYGRGLSAEVAHGHADSRC